MIVVAPPGGNINLDLTVAAATGVDVSPSDPFGVSGVDAVLAHKAAVAVFSGSLKDSRDPVYVVFTGRLAPLAEECEPRFADQSTRLINLTDSPLSVRSLADLYTPLIQSNAQILELSADSTGELDLQCFPTDKLLWSGSRQTRYLRVPQLLIARSATLELRAGQSFDDVSVSELFLKGLPKSHDCVTVSYRLGRQEAVEANSAWVTEQQDKQSPYLRSWKSCAAATSSFQGDSGIQISATKEVWWRWATGGLDRLVVTDLGQEGTVQRDVFLGGLALGLVGALIVEMVGVLLEFAERSPMFLRKMRHIGNRLEKRWQRRMECSGEFEQLSLW
jgi:hypothetical protein